MNKERPTKYHLHAKDFAEALDGSFEGILFDPPYSPRQTKECYDSICYDLSLDDVQGFPCSMKKLFAPKIKTGGYAICFGWNSNGFGKKLGFEMIDVLLVPHGSNHNDTIVTVERKFTHDLWKKK